ncbi:hypothetical protein V6N13_114372 [Hibiscus sabdariffa]
MSALGISLKNPIGEASTVAPGISNDDPVAVVGRPKVRFDYPHVLERPGSSVPHENQRATKKVKNKDDMTCMGKENESIRHESFDLTEMDERLAVVGNPHANSTLPSVAPRFSYVGAVSGMKQSTACEFATPLTNEIVVTKDDVKIDNRNMDWCGKQNNSEENNQGTKVTIVSESEVYGPWMLASYKNRRPRKDTATKKLLGRAANLLDSSRFQALQDLR